jgi:hypothetical protein
MSGPRRPASLDRPISITAVVDCVGCLADRSLRGNLYLYDTNRSGGSTGLGTEELMTRVRRGDSLVWTVLPLECEAYVDIAGILIDKAVCEPDRRVYPGTDVSYWVGTVKRDNLGVVPYRIAFTVGTRTDPMLTLRSPALVEGVPGTGPTARREEER